MRENPIEGFRRQVDAIYGVFLHSAASFVILLKEIGKWQRSSRTEGNLSIEYLDQALFMYDTGKPTDSSSVVLHAITQGELKRRLTKNGPNTMFLANLCLVAIYQFWEEEYRVKISGLLRGSRLDSDVMGDVRLLRIAVIHRGAVARDQILRCKVLKWFRPGDPIQISEDRMHALVQAIGQECDKWREAHSRTVDGDRPVDQ